MFSFLICSFISRNGEKLLAQFSWNLWMGKSLAKEEPITFLNRFKSCGQYIDNLYLLSKHYIWPLLNKCIHVKIQKMVVKIVVKYSGYVKANCRDKLTPYHNPYSGVAITFSCSKCRSLWSQSGPWVLSEAVNLDQVEVLLCHRREMPISQLVQVLTVPFSDNCACCFGILLRLTKWLH